MQTIVYWKCVVVAFARVKGWVNLIKKLKLASVCFPEKKKKNTVKLFVFLQVLFSDFSFWCVNYQETDGSDKRLLVRGPPRYETGRQVTRAGGRLPKQPSAPAHTSRLKVLTL